jgi:lipopolysaccharide transport system ATP-binding protein
MPDLVIRAENLGKKYTIGHQAEHGRSTALRDVLMQNARSLWHKTRGLAHGTSEAVRWRSSLFLCLFYL